MPDRYALVLAGGRGERFWPWSRPERPKQLLPLAHGGRSLLAATLDRLRHLIPPSRCLVMTARDLVPAVEKECPRGTRVIGEPVGRNTAPAIAAAAHAFAAEVRDASFAVLPSDHAIDDEAAFVADLERGFRAAESDPVLVTYGIHPTNPETALGYIRRGAALGDRLFRDRPVIDALQALVADNTRWGFWKCHDALRFAGRPWNHRRSAAPR